MQEIMTKLLSPFIKESTDSENKNDTLEVKGGVNITVNGKIVESGTTEEKKAALEQVIAEAVAKIMASSEIQNVSNRISKLESDAGIVNPPRQDK